MRGVASQTRTRTTERRNNRRDPCGTVAFTAPERYTLPFNASQNPDSAKAADIFRYCVFIAMLKSSPYLACNYILCSRSLGMIMWQIRELDSPFKGSQIFSGCWHTSVETLPLYIWRSTWPHCDTCHYNGEATSSNSDYDLLLDKCWNGSPSQRPSLDGITLFWRKVYTWGCRYSTVLVADIIERLHAINEEPVGSSTWLLGIGRSECFWAARL